MTLKRHRRFLFGVALAIFVIGADQLSKHLILKHFLALPPFAPPAHVMPSLNFVLSLNHGVTFGMFNGGASTTGAVIFSVLAVVIAGFLLVWLWQAQRSWLAIALGLVAGGALGNVIDRIHYGGVVDFIDFYIGNWHWYTFNVADSCICTGVAMLLLDSLATRSGSPK